MLRLLVFVVYVYPESRVFLLEVGERAREVGCLVPIGLMASEMTGSGTNMQVGHRIVRGSIGKHILGRALNTNDRADLAWTDLIDVLHLVAMHVHQLGNPDSLYGAPHGK